MSKNKIRLYASKLFFCPGFILGVLILANVLIFCTQYGYIGWELIIFLFLIYFWIKELEINNIYEECNGQKILKRYLKK